MRYSSDLREHVLDFIEVGGSKAKGSRRFCVPRPTIDKWLKAPDPLAYVPLFSLLIPSYFMKGALMTVSESEKSPRYNGIPKQVSRKDFNRYILPHLKKRIKGPKPKLSFYKIFNYILYVLHNGSYENLFQASVIHLLDKDQLDTTRFHGDGSNTVVKKGATASATPDTNIRKAKKS